MWLAEQMDQKIHSKQEAFVSKSTEGCGEEDGGELVERPS